MLSLSAPFSLLIFSLLFAALVLVEEVDSNQSRRPFLSLTHSPPPPPPREYYFQQPPKFERSLPFVLTLVLAAFFFIGFFTIYVCRCILDCLGDRSLRRRRAEGNTALQRPPGGPRGLDPDTIASFQTFPYSEVESLKRGLECAVCLSEFAGEELLRLLPICNHAFHPVCIDQWLSSHTTCPVCRGNLVPEAIDIDTEDALEPESVSSQGSPTPVAAENMMLVKDSDDNVHRRSHSTGHSMRRPAVEEGVSSGFSGERGDDRFTLRLPQGVRERIARVHERGGSCVTFRELRVCEIRH
ncbi:hypothetical protein AMTRI_Chr03g146250 [Amborella trichopoda]